LVRKGAILAIGNLLANGADEVMSYISLHEQKQK